ncbi:hypothetical protein CRM22_002101 [Opisthorchis felineus]|uniref:Uncharacterized protein n=1 Tax=Opisthorchis felineus TaxID=147828 RepID=A0A4S2M7K7_OPIFE|nr:hypothetical protein CRM22_002101 [Opisthorchis felineus]
MILSKIARPSSIVIRRFASATKQADFVSRLKHNYFVRNYHVTFLICVFSTGLLGMLVCSIINLTDNPDVRTPFSKIPRNESYFDRLSFGSFRGTLETKPPVRMHWDGTIEHPYDPEEPVSKPAAAQK